MQWTVYTTATCGFCKQLKRYLTENNVSFTEKHADTDQALAQELFTKSGQLGVPFSIVIDDAGDEHHILGFDQEHIATLITESQ